eukprot:CAMPEP_0119416316 /NCGR_PEP_ID=MMETSP1335-20130426/12465_1 /TAXON_ID=259385 /ORGANISM="Chrysoculter rhomboideus, Strain RCC1486" /LENGTH=79 /DNA_ID=CAMNT_0007441427 /DNA_START=293 /DNA_END=529 /DNA_ORIENTATION=+
MRIEPGGTPRALPHACMTNGSLVAVQITVSTPAAFSSSPILMKLGACVFEHVGVNAPGTAKTTTVFPGAQRLFSECDTA